MRGQGKFVFTLAAVLFVHACSKENTPAPIHPSTTDLRDRTSRDNTPTPLPIDPNSDFPLDSVRGNIALGFTVLDLQLFEQLFQPFRRMQNGRILAEWRVRMDLLHCGFQSRLSETGGNILVGRAEIVNVVSSVFDGSWRMYQTTLSEKNAHFLFHCSRTGENKVTLGELETAFGPMVFWRLVDATTGEPILTPTPTPAPGSTVTPMPTPTPTATPTDDVAMSSFRSRDVGLVILNASRLNALSEDPDEMRLQAGRVVERDDVNTALPYCYASMSRSEFSRQDRFELQAPTERNLGRSRELVLRDLGNRFEFTCYQRGASFRLRDIRAVFQGLAEFSINSN